jgi:glycosyltransferase involved in cell wall biosynthesis
MPGLPDVSFVIPCFRSRQTIGATLGSIRRQLTDFRCEVIVVDSSADETASWLGSLFPEVQVIACPQRLYPGAARNLGAEKAKGKILAFLDADAAVSPDWLALLAARLGGTGGSERPVLIGAAVANANPEKLPSRILHWIEFSEYLPGLPSGPRTALSSSNLLVLRDAFRSSGGFSETYGMAEDLLFCRNWRGGLFFEGAASVFHQHRDRWETVLAHLQALGYWSGKLRSSEAASGAWLKRRPVLALGLPLLRAARITARVNRSSRVEGARALILNPVLLWALGHWARGFRKGLRGR